MKHLLTGVAMVAALGFSMPIWAQPAPAPSDTTSAMPPHHRHAHHAMHGKPAHHPSRFPNLQGNVANQLNQAELQRLQAGNFSMPPGPPPPGMAPPPPGMMPPPRPPGLAPQGGSSGAGPR